MYLGLKHAHSGLRWLVLFFLVWAIVNAFQKRKSATEFTAKDKRPTLIGPYHYSYPVITGSNPLFLSVLL